MDEYFSRELSRFQSTPSAWRETRFKPFTLKTIL